MLARFGLAGSLLAPALALAACAGGAPAAPRPSDAPAAPSSASAPAARAPAPATAPAPPAAPPPAATLKIAALPSIASAARYVAVDRGYLREQGIELEEVPSTTSAQMLPSLAAGQVDMGLGGAAAGGFHDHPQGHPGRPAPGMWAAFS